MTRILNPYIVGTPIPSQELFYGREELLSFVRDTLNPPKQRVVVFYGQRRIGKTSVLYELARRLHGEFHPVYFDLMGQANRPLVQALHEIATQVADSLDEEPPPSFTDPLQFRDFLEKICAIIPDGTHLLLLLDEFDDLSDQEIIPGAAAQTLFDYLRDLLNTDLHVAFIFVVGRRLTELPENFKSILKQAPQRRIAFLSEDETHELVVQPAKEMLDYTPEAVDAIYRLTSGHPYFTQLICFELFRKLQKRDDKTVMEADVTAVLDHAMETGQGGLSWFWDALPLAERFVMSAIAEISNPNKFASTEEVRERLANYDLRFLGLEITDAPNLLAQWEILRRSDGGYQFAVELIRLWILAEHPLSTAKREVENLSSRASHFFALARSEHLNGEFVNAIEYYEQALNANPNHFRSQLGLAQALTEIKDVQAAHEAYLRAYEMDHSAARDGLIHSYEKLAGSEERDGSLQKAIQYLEKAQELAANDERQLRIEFISGLIEEEKRRLEKEEQERRKKRQEWLLWGKRIAAAIGMLMLIIVFIFAGFFLVDRFLQPTPTVTAVAVISSPSLEPQITTPPPSSIATRQPTSTPLPTYTPPPTYTPIPTSTPTSIPTPTQFAPVVAVVKKPNTELYLGASIYTGVRALLQVGDTVLPTGITEDNRWYSVQAERNDQALEGWVQAENLEFVSGTIGSLPVVVPTISVTIPSPSACNLDVSIKTSPVLNSSFDDVRILLTGTYPTEAHHLLLTVSSVDGRPLVYPNFIDFNDPDFDDYGYLIGSWLFEDRGFTDNTMFNYSLQVLDVNDNELCAFTGSFTQ